MNSILINFKDKVDMNKIYNQLKKLYPDTEIIKNYDGFDESIGDTHTPDGKPKKKFATKKEYLEFLDDLCGSIDDPTMVEPPEIRYESPREPII